jgi:hypothetical protein
MGSGAVAIGADARDLHFSGIRLGETATLAERYTRAGATQGETRSHGFFYRGDAPDRGLIGLPIRSGGSAGHEHLVNGSASVLFLRNDDFHLTEVGNLASRDTSAVDDCRASCVDWYGNARPIFLPGGRIVALMGYELVEGREAGGRIDERRRVNFAPSPPDVAGSWDYSEVVGIDNSRYRCESRGTYAIAQDGRLVSVRYRQSGTCVVDRVSSDASGEGVGTGVAVGGAVWITFENCRVRGRLTTPDRLEGRMGCEIQFPEGTRTTVAGTWSATRSATR